MKQFDDWWEMQNIPSDIIPPHLEDALVDAFKAGMLAAADIAELAKEFILPADDLADLIAKQIREYADDD